jgi:hypothetical protein
MGAARPQARKAPASNDPGRLRQIFARKVAFVNEQAA